MVTDSSFSGVDRAISTLLEISSFHLSHSCLIGKGSVSFQGIFRSQTSRYDILPVKCAGEIRPIGSQAEASSLKIFLFVVLFPLTSEITTDNLSVSLFHLRPKILVLLEPWLNICFAYTNLSF